jgi:hypothetical protein
MCHDPLHRLGCRYSGSWHVPRPAESAAHLPLQLTLRPEAHGQMLEIPPQEALPWALSHRDALIEFVARAGWTDPAEDQGGSRSHGDTAPRSSPTPAAGP